MIGWKESASLASAIEDRMERLANEARWPARLTDSLLRAVDALGQAR